MIYIISNFLISQCPKSGKNITNHNNINQKFIKTQIMKIINYYLIFLLALMLSGLHTYAQNTLPENLLRYIQEHKTDWQLTDADVKNPLLTSQHTSQHNGVTHLYFRQTHEGISVHNAVMNANVAADASVLSMGNRFVSDLAAKINATEPNISPIDAVNASARELQLSPENNFLIQKNINTNEYEISDGGIASEPIQAKLMYLPVEGQGVRLVWQCGIYTGNRQHYWQVSIDAVNGKVLDQRDKVIHCDFHTPAHQASPKYSHHRSAGFKPCASVMKGSQTCAHTLASKAKNIAQSTDNQKNTSSAVGSYNVFPVPVESPIHGSRQIVTDPENLTASPYGWHDTDGVAGAEFTITRGNNVVATEDTLNENMIGYAPDGGSNLNFDFPLDFSLSPVSNLDATITNLFYWNNIMHDVWYLYGFDEAAGNFQDNNYGNGGLGSDYVMAQAQDGGGTNNANFFSGTDGTNGRMQMYLWRGLTDDSFVGITSPESIAGEYDFGGAGFGPDEYMVSGKLVEAVDASANPSLACEPIVNGAEVNGNIAMIDRGDCLFVNKVLNAEIAGAIAVIVCNNVEGEPITMGGTDPGITIPSIMFTMQDCATIRAELPDVEVTINVGTFLLDSSFDNGVIAHEYGHGISIRGTGGGGESGCLDYDWQMGEGWSDWFALVMTAKPGDQATDARGIGNYASDRGADGVGIRRYPYTTDMTINPHTYAAVDTMNIPHGVGSVWCAMAWDMYWALVDQHGFDEDLYNGTGGNNIAMQLIMDGIKMQPCNPTFPETRDAILMADQVNYNGENQCLIWEAFARRGIGTGATAGPVNDFDVPSACTSPLPPITSFSANAQSCDGLVCFRDETANIPQQWAWDFGDGNTSNEQHPTHQYTQSGTYTVTLEAGNSTGAITVSRTDYITVNIPQTPDIQYNGECDNGLATLSATTDAGTIEWLDESGDLVATGNTFTTQPQSDPQTYYAQSVVAQNSKAGPENRLIGSGTYHDSDFRGQVFFDAHQSFTLLSLLVDAGSEGERTFFLENANGTVIESVTVNLQPGPQRVDINWNITPGSYALAGQSVNLYRNDSGVSYPYTHCSGTVTITGSPTQAGPDYYYYFYDWEIETTCVSEQSSVMVDCVVGIDDNPLVEVFNIAPNPNTGTFDLTLIGDAQQNIELTVFDVLGKNMYQNNYNFQSGQLMTRLTLPNITSGTFFVKVSNGDRVNYQKIIVY